MARMAIQNQLFRKVVGARGSYGQREPAFAPVGWQRAIFAARAKSAHKLRRGLTLLIALLFLTGAALYSPAAHSLIEADAPSITLANEAVNALGEPTTPAKSAMPSLCTGHCAAHVLTLPILSPEPGPPIMVRSVWLVVNDQASQASSPALLERPPRV